MSIIYKCSYVLALKKTHFRLGSDDLEVLCVTEFPIQDFGIIGILCTIIMLSFHPFISAKQIKVIAPFLIHGGILHLRNGIVNFLCYEKLSDFKFLGPLYFISLKNIS